MGNRSVKRIGTFTVGAVIVAAVFAFSPLIVPMISSAPASFRAMLASATEGGSSESLTANAESGAVPADVVPEEAAGADSSDVPARPADATVMTVDYVHDGDTLFLLPADAATSDSSRLKVRLLGLDTPEVGDNAECYGSEATEQLRALLPEGTEVGVTGDVEPLDQYGRSLFYLWTEDGHFVNYELVAGGAAEEVTYAPNDAYSELLRWAEDSARSSGVGLWGTCS
ncbi:thermonuclease family protein [Leifsonia sp. YAF41]|uniref:thermonuclease family protein n=1 Tax=Leifsonia sp. YAF41 TaxID=3233086 RepID=UPI003F9A4BC7